MELLRLLLLTLRGDMAALGDRLQVLVLCTPAALDAVVAVLGEATAGVAGRPPIALPLAASTVFDVAVNKLQVAGWDGVTQFDRVVYMDVDMLVIRPLLTSILALPLAADTVYAMGEPGYAMDHEYFARPAAPYSPADWAYFAAVGAQPINTGLLMFAPSPAVLAALAAAYHAAAGTPPDERPAYCMEQPYVNAALFTGRLVNWTALQPYVVIDTKRTRREGTLLPDTVAVVHVTGQTDDASSVGSSKLARAHTLFARWHAATVSVGVGGGRAPSGVTLATLCH